MYEIPDDNGANTYADRIQLNVLKTYGRSDGFGCLAR